MYVLDIEIFICKIVDIICYRTLKTSSTATTEFFAVSKVLFVNYEFFEYEVLVGEHFGIRATRRIGIL